MRSWYFNENADLVGKEPRPGKGLWLGDTDETAHLGLDPDPNTQQWATWACFSTSLILSLLIHEMDVITSALRAVGRATQNGVCRELSTVPLT